MKNLRSKLTASKLKLLANSFCPTPREAYMRMINALKALEIYLHLVIVRNRFGIMIDLKLSTEEVIHTAKKVIGRGKRGFQDEESRIMKLRKRQIEKEGRKAWYNWKKERKFVETLLMKADRIFYMFRIIEKEFKQYVWTELMKISKQKVGFAIKKKKKREIQNRFDSREERFYLVTDEELFIDGEINKQLNYEIYGNILLTENERKCLELGPKYNINPNTRKRRF